MTHTRLTALLQKMASANLDVIALMPGPNLFYLTGLSFHLSERPIVAFFSRHADPAMVLPGFEAGKSAQAPYFIQTFPYAEDDAALGEAFRQAAKALGLAGAQVGVEGRRMRVMELHHLETVAPGASFHQAEPTLAALRMTKDLGELAAMRKAVAIAEIALKAWLPKVKVGLSEKELASELTAQILTAGSESEMAFTPIVASGPNSALPHAFPSDRLLQHGDLLIVDWGAAVRGYFSDITRTFAIGEVDQELKQVYELVRQANAAGKAAVKPGAACQDVDRAARKVIADSGYGEFFFHRTGHGLGLEGHEEPYLREGDTLPLAEGMSFTVEPGIYLPGRGGVRIEDDLVVTAEGAECLTDYPRELQILSGMGNG